MATITVMAQHLIEAGKWDDESEDHLHLRRKFGDHQQTIFVPEGNSLEDRFTLSQTLAGDFLSKPETEDFVSLESALLKAETWKRQRKK